MLEVKYSIPTVLNYDLKRPANNPSATTRQYSADSSQSTKLSFFERHLSTQKKDTYRRVLDICKVLIQKPGVHSAITMNAAGFRYTGNGDTVCCDTCNLEVSKWTVDMKPFAIHMQRSSACAFVRSVLPTEQITVQTMTILPFITSTSNDEEKPIKRQKTEATHEHSQPNIIVEVDMMKQIRKRTFSHWPHRTSPLSSQMIEAGFFNCNVGDRVICLYCNIICQQWTPHADDPWETHKTLSPKCPYVVAVLTRSQTSSIPIVNEYSTSSQSSVTTDFDPLRCNEIVYTAACHTAYIEIPKRHASFATWPNENLPPVDDLVRAGFFYTGTKTIVTCFYCNGSLQNWGVNDNPTIEHVRWFPHCAYAKQLCGAELYRKIQESKRAQQERAGANEPNKRSGTNDGCRGQLNIPDESTLSRFVAARLDLPISQSLLDRNYKLSIIKRCWEDQLRLKRDDFVDFCDLLMACMILQKQIERIDGKKENIFVPSVAINKIREREQGETLTQEQNTSLPILTNSSNNSDVEMSTSSESILTEANPKESAMATGEKKEIKAANANILAKDQADDSSSSNLCVLCLTEEKHLACIPCGHLATCVPCGHSLRSCPICRTGIDAFVRIYL